MQLTYSINYFVRKNSLALIALFLIISISITLWIPWNETFSNGIFLTDDVFYISASNGILEGRGLVIDFNITPEAGWSYINSFHRWHDADFLIKYYPLGQQYSGKGPLNYLLISFIFLITNATPENWYFWGSVATGISTIFLIIAHFIFSRKYFGLNVAIVSGFIIATLTTTVVLSGRIVPYALTYALIVCAFIFTKKTKRDYFLFGIFIGLAHLTHPLGFIPGFVYLLFLLFHREFKGAIMVLGTWMLLLVPWFVRNIIEFGDPNYGFKIPLLSEFSEFLDLGRFVKAPYIVPPPAVPNPGPIFPTDTIIGLFQSEITLVYGMVSVVVLLFFIIFAFFSPSKLKELIFNIKQLPKRKKISTFLIFGVFAIYLVIGGYIFAGGLQDQSIEFKLKTQLTFIFLVPLLIATIFYSYGDKLKIDYSRISSLIVFFGFVSIIFYYIYAVQQVRPVPEIKFLLPFFYIAIPLGIYGLENIIKSVISKFKFTTNKRYPLLIMLIVFLIVSPLELKNGWTYWEDEIVKNVHQEHPTWKKMHNWILENIEEDAMIMSDLPPVVFLKTGLKSVELPIADVVYHNSQNLEKYIKHYDINYVVMYYRWDYHSFDSEDSGLFHYEKVYEDDGDALSIERNQHYVIYKITQNT